jgi:hypothetical protein
LDQVGQTENEVAVIVGGVTSMLMELSKWDAMAGAMAVRTWVDNLKAGFEKVRNNLKEKIMRMWL